MDPIRNPILPGFSPDPSVCRVGRDFYLVTSSFAFFPGLPVFHSRDLRHWECIGHVIDRPGMVPLDGRDLSGGLWAPTLREHDGVFFLICAHARAGDFVCTAGDPAGPWSEPHWIPGAPGIDPSLFWDEDGRCYLTGNDWSRGPCHIWGCGFDPEAFRLIGEPKELWRGALRDCHAPEAPHLYKKDGRYYLLIAEGGTGFYHAVTIARSESPLGEYRGYPGNPILTHRHLGTAAGITCTGHGDLVQTQDGKWFMVLLGCRPEKGRTLLGRETFLAQVDWSGEWPVVSPGAGRVTETVPDPGLPPFPAGREGEDPLAGPLWVRLGDRSEEAVRVRDGVLRIRCVSAPLIPPEGETKGPCIGFCGRRLASGSFSCSVHAALPEAEGASCGLTVLQNRFHSLRAELLCRDQRPLLRFVRARFDTENKQCLEEVLLEEGLPAFSAGIGISADNGMFSMYLDGERMAETDGAFLSVEEAGGFIGAHIGLFASGNGRDAGAFAEFRDWRMRE